MTRSLCSALLWSNTSSPANIPEMDGSRSRLLEMSFCDSLYIRVVMHEIDMLIVVVQVFVILVCTYFCINTLVDVGDML